MNIFDMLFEYINAFAKFLDECYKAGYLYYALAIIFVVGIYILVFV